MELRNYQKECITAVYDKIKNGKNPLIYISTGGGKSAIFSKIALDARSKNRNVLIVVNKLILIDNAIKSLRQFGLEATIYCGDEKEISPLMCGTIQSLYRMKESDFSVIIWDEAHRFDQLEKVSTKIFLSKFSNCINIGCTATPWRNGKPIYGEGMFWDLAYEKGLKELTEEKYLVPIIYQNQSKESVIDISNVKKDSEDYVLSALQDEIMNHEEKIELQVKDALEKSKERKKIVVVTTGIDHCEKVLSFLGEEATMLHSKLSDIDREKNLAEFNSGKKRILVSVLIVSEGYDDPAIDCIWMKRPTRSPVLYTQVAGRGLRISEGKNNLLFLDYGNIVNELGSIYDVKLKKDKKQESKFKLECPICNMIFFNPRNKCECEYVFTRTCLYCDEVLPMMDACKCQDRLNAKVKNLTVESYSFEKKTMRINNPIMEFSYHQGPKQEVLLVKIRESVFSLKRHHWYLPQFKLNRIATIMQREINNIEDVKRIFQSEIKYIVLEKKDKYFSPYLVGIENKTFEV